jgi:hypothetical protein
MNLKNHPDTWWVLMPILGNMVTFPPRAILGSQSWGAVLGLGFGALP